MAGRRGDGRRLRRVEMDELVLVMEMVNRRGFEAGLGFLKARAAIR